MLATEATEAGADLPLLPVLTLAEEELLVLNDGSPGVVPPRVQEPAEAAAADLVRSVALRTLMARGLILPTGAATEGQTSWEAVEPLGLTLSLRALAPSVLALQRVLGPLLPDEHEGLEPPRPTTAVRYLHLHREVAVLEDVTEDGMHGLLTVFPDRYPEAVADFIRPPDASPGQGAVRSLGDGAEPVAALLAALGHPTVLVEAALLRVGAADLGQEGGSRTAEPVSQMLALGPGGTFRSHDSRAYHPVDPDGVIRELLEEALAGESATATQVVA